MATKSVVTKSAGKVAIEKVTATTPTTPTTTIPLPSWTDAASVTSYITSILGAVFAVITGLHPGYTEPTIVQVLLPIVGALVAGVAQIVNIVTHRTVQKAAVSALVSTN